MELLEKSSINYRFATSKGVKRNSELIFIRN